MNFFSYGIVTTPTLSPPSDWLIDWLIDTAKPLLLLRTLLLLECYTILSTFIPYSVVASLGLVSPGPATDGKKYFSRVSPPGGCHPGRSPSDATVIILCIVSFVNCAILKILTTMMMMMMMMCAGCNCNPAGSLDLQCHVVSGACRCRANIDGQNCDRCEENKYNIEAGCLG